MSYFSQRCIKCHQHKPRKGGKGAGHNGTKLICKDCYELAKSRAGSNSKRRVDDSKERGPVSAVERADDVEKRSGAD